MGNTLMYGRRVRGKIMNKMEKFWDAVYVWQLFLAPLGCLSAGIYYSYCKYKGFYEQVPWRYIIAFFSSQLLYVAIAGMLLRIRKKNVMAPGTYVRVVKTFVSTILLLQYCSVMLVFPAFHTWGCTFFFLIYILFLFDFKVMIYNVCGYMLVAVIAHVVCRDQHLLAENGTRFETLLFRVVIFVLYCIFSIAISYLMEKFIKQLEFEEEKMTFLSQQQLKYYQNLDLMDEELRKFRHDITNHFLCMQELTEREDLLQLKQYFRDLLNDYSQNGQVYFSGNVIVDSILNYDLSHLCGKNVVPVIYGRLPQIESVSSMDLCTVFSNMLSNAIKGANLLEYENELLVSFRGGEQYFSILVTNQVGTVRGEAAEEDRNHGYGVRNIMEVIEKYQGIFEQGENAGIFMMQVYLPI